MKNYKLIKWKPINKNFNKVCCNSIDYNYEGLTFKLKNEEQKASFLTINFEFFLAFRIIHEELLLKDLHDVHEHESEVESHSGSYYEGGLFIVENSSFLKWFQEQSGGIHEGLKITHYLIITSDNVIEVLASVIPVVKWN